MRSVISSISNTRNKKHWCVQVNVYMTENICFVFHFNLYLDD